MPHFKCVECRLRLALDRSPAGDEAGDSCPVCGTPLEPVADLREVVGFQSVEAPAAERWLDDEDTLPGVQTVALPLPGSEL